MKRLREHGLHARTVQLKLRFEGFETITRAKSLGEATNIDRDVVEAILRLFKENWPTQRAVRLLGVHVSQLTDREPQPNLLSGHDDRKWRGALQAADRLKDKYGEGMMHLGGALRGVYQDRVHEAAPKPFKSVGDPKLKG